jgi:hypothetical protein
VSAGAVLATTVKVNSSRRKAGEALLIDDVNIYISSGGTLTAICDSGDAINCGQALQNVATGVQCYQPATYTVHDVEGRRKTSGVRAVEYASMALQFVLVRVLSARASLGYTCRVTTEDDKIIRVGLLLRQTVDLTWIIS